MKDKYKVVLVTTKGCEGCRIQKNLLDKVYEDYIGSYKYTTIDKDKIKETFASVCTNTEEPLVISDFPATIFIIDNWIFRTCIGTRTKETLKQYVEEMLQTGGVYHKVSK